MEDQENKEEIKSFEDLGQSENIENDIIIPEKEVDDLGRSYATGKSKGVQILKITSAFYEKADRKADGFDRKFYSFFHFPLSFPLSFSPQLSHF